MKRMHHCFNCGAECGIYQAFPGDVRVCGESECVRAEQDHYRTERDMRIFEAQADDYERYR